MAMSKKLGGPPRPGGVAVEMHCTARAFQSVTTFAWPIAADPRKTQRARTLELFKFVIVDLLDEKGWIAGIADRDGAASIRPRRQIVNPRLQPDPCVPRIDPPCSGPERLLYR